LTRRYAEESVAFMKRNKEKPFFLYLAPNMPHLPLAASGKFRGKSKRGIYGDAVEELDWGVGEILRGIRDLGLEKDTLVIFTSDNGPAQVAKPENGSAGPLRGRKASTWEGGLREPAIARWPGKIPAGISRSQITSTMDVLPTLAKLAGASLPKNRIDGVDIFPVLAGTNLDKPPRETFYYYSVDRLQAVRSGKWKLHVDRPDLKNEGMPLLYDLEADIGESTNVAAAHADVVARLQKIADEARRDLGDKATGVTGSGVRAVGTI
jgi:arylsulfatase A